MKPEKCESPSKPLRRGPARNGQGTSLEAPDRRGIVLGIHGANLRTITEAEER